MHFCKDCGFALPINKEGKAEACVSAYCPSTTRQTGECAYDHPCNCCKCGKPGRYDEHHDEFRCPEHGGLPLHPVETAEASASEVVWKPEIASPAKVTIANLGCDAYNAFIAGMGEGGDRLAWHDLIDKERDAWCHVARRLLQKAAGILLLLDEV